MRNARFWTGWVFCAGLPLSLIMGTVGGASSRSSTLEGTITVNGRIVTDAVVLFESLDRSRSGDIMMLIDRDGRFGHRVEWPLLRSGRTRFRVHLIVHQRTLPDSPEIWLGAEPTRLEIALKK